MKQLNVLIVGAGIGGLTHALCLSRAGHRVTVLEANPDAEFVGAGIQISPNATKVLQHIGLGPGLALTASLPASSAFRHWRSGALIYQTQLGSEMNERFGAPYYHLLRSDLMRLLIDAAEQDPRIDLRFGVKVLDFKLDGDAVLLQSAEQTFTGQVLVGADGIHSSIRERLFGDQPPRFTGQVAWRLLVPAAGLKAGSISPAVTVWWGPGQHFVHYNVGQGDWVNCVCVLEKKQWTQESWTQPGNRCEVAQDFKGWHPIISELIAASDASQIYQWALFDRPELPSWGTGPVTLLGDACHATLPFMAQGAAMAIEDALVLSRCLSEGTQIKTSLKRYETLRKPRTAYVQRASKRNGRVFHARAPFTWLRNRVTPWAGQQTMDRLYGYDALAAV
ncbi:MAG: salicylate hydroxylase [Candidatus Azotimanducaceae bacterium]|jgi:salicylate hydroxylase|tara:strand:+ start:3215 stop:4390 length:1176 start_codon:yes stop_codon:yes gene_type:complete